MEDSRTEGGYPLRSAAETGNRGLQLVKLDPETGQAKAGARPETAGWVMINLVNAYRVEENKNNRTGAEADRGFLLDNHYWYFRKIKMEDEKGENLRINYSAITHALSNLDNAGLVRVESQRNKHGKVIANKPRKIYLTRRGLAETEKLLGKWLKKTEGK